MLLGGVAAAALAFGAGWVLRGDLQNSDLGKKFEKRLAIEREVSVRREVNLWTQIGDERRARVELIATVQKIDQLSAEARAKMVAALAREKEAALAAQAAADRNIEELRNAASDMAVQWKRGVIPPDITCGVFRGSGCPAPAYPATGADRDDGVEVRQPAAAAPAAH